MFATMFYVVTLQLALKVDPSLTGPENYMRLLSHWLIRYHLAMFLFLVNIIWDPISCEAMIQYHFCTNHVFFITLFDYS